ncbi:DUF2273 domain-containing protein [Paenibacillus alkalitolerans]|uniref:DUF2273 domain-containing protein n=1 Tax=Paenibacillus alkalitolerans TaxID=2799335 RepID=UPI0018F6CFCC|nr:DUF2273 domain-containing protein [Paenibacillus alkalitolerans]
MWKLLAERVTEWVGAGRIGRLLGTAAGVVLGFIYLIWGFWDMLAFALIVTIGYTLGLKSDFREKWFDIRSVLRWLTDRWYK